MLICEYCKKEFIVSKTKQRCCSVKCWHKLNYQNKKEQFKKTSKEWYQNNAERKKAYRKKYYKENGTNKIRQKLQPKTDIIQEHVS